MILTADYHTHTKYSHGKGTILQNAYMAKEKNLSYIGIADHGFSHPAFGLSKRKLPKMQKECIDATNETGVKVLLGVESNVVSDSGLIDASKYYDYFDILLCGIHKFILYRPKTMVSLFARNYLTNVLKCKPSKSLIKENTKTFINVVKNNPIDIITHLNYCCFSDSLEVAKVCADYGTYLEISAKKEHLNIEEWQNIVNKTSCRFIISSDAHSPSRVGDFELAKSVIKKAGIPLDRIDNIDGRLPDFRFKKFKEQR